MLQIQQKGYFQSIREFHIYEDKMLGTGSFGIVKLAVHINTSKIYAIKIINIKSFSSEAELKLIEREVKIHSQIHHPHIIKLWDSFSENELLYMVMEYAERGNLFYYQNSRTVFPELEAFKYFYQTSQALKFLHSQDIIHRDLKPQNLLLDSDYNVKLCDFGWGTQRVSMRRTTFCGTYEYMAPEMLFESEYDEKIDIWALGILLYEMLHGIAPFKGETAAEVKEKMTIGSYTISSHLSTEVMELIVLLLRFKPEDRATFHDIESHPWVAKMSDSLASQYLHTLISHNINERKDKFISSEMRTINSYTSISERGNIKSSSIHKKLIIEGMREKPTESATLTHIFRRDDTDPIFNHQTQRYIEGDNKRSTQKRLNAHSNQLSSDNKSKVGSKKPKKKSKPKAEKLQKIRSSDYLSRAELAKEGKPKSKSKTKSKSKEREKGKSSKKLQKSRSRMMQGGHVPK